MSKTTTATKLTKGDRVIVEGRAVQITGVKTDQPGKLTYLVASSTSGRWAFMLPSDREVKVVGRDPKVVAE